MSAPATIETLSALPDLSSVFGRSHGDLPDPLRQYADTLEAQIRATLEAHGIDRLDDFAKQVRNGEVAIADGESVLGKLKRLLLTREAWNPASYEQKNVMEFKNQVASVSAMPSGDIVVETIRAVSERERVREVSVVDPVTGTILFQTETDPLGFYYGHVLGVTSTNQILMTKAKRVASDKLVAIALIIWQPYDGSMETFSIGSDVTKTRYVGHQNMVYSYLQHADRGSLDIFDVDQRKWGKRIPMTEPFDYLYGVLPSGKLIVGSINISGFRVLTHTGGLISPTWKPAYLDRVFVLPNGAVASQNKNDGAWYWDIPNTGSDIWLGHIAEEGYITMLHQYNPSFPRMAVIKDFIGTEGRIRIVDVENAAAVWEWNFESKTHAGVAISPLNEIILNFENKVVIFGPKEKL